MHHGENSRVRALFDRTWELELLISGVVVFGLVQVPTRLASLYERVDVLLGEETRMIAWMAYFYLQLMVISLCAALFVHLIARAYWVGLIGLNSVFPKGIRWADLKSYGPRTKAFYRAVLPSLPTLIRTADAFCSSIFSIAFVAVIVFLFSIVIVVPLITVSTFVNRVWFDGERSLLTMYASLVLLLLPVLLAPLVDRMAPTRGRRSWADRFVRGVIRPYHAIFGGPLYNPIMLTFMSNARQSSFAVVSVGLFGLLFVFIFVMQLATGGALTFHDLRFSPLRPGAATVAPVYYESLRAPGRVYTEPSIQDDVVDGPYVKLFLPYVPRRHNELIEQRCPSVESLQPGGLRLRRLRLKPLTDELQGAADAVRLCLAGLYQVWLNGGAVSPDYVFYQHPGSGLRGLMAYLPTEGLPAGANLLRIRPLRIDDEDDEKDEPPSEHLIPFWR